MKNTTRPFVESIRHNVRVPGGAPVKRTLGRLTCIIGPPGSGKTSDIHALELALSGAADDVAGRNGVKTPNILGDLVESADGLTAHAVFSDQRESAFLLEAKRTGGWRKPAQPRFGNALVYRDIEAFILKGGPGARNILLRWISAGIDEEEVLAEISSRFHPRWRDIVQAKAEGKRPLEQLALVASYAKSQAAAAKREADAADKAADVLIGQRLAAPSAAELAQAQADQRKAQQALEAAVASVDVQGIDEIEERQAMQEATSAASGWRQEAERYDALADAEGRAEGQENQEPADDPEYFRAVLRVLEVSEVGGDCGVCGYALQPGHPHALRRWAQQNIARLEEARAEEVAQRALKVREYQMKAEKARSAASEWERTEHQHRERLRRVLAAPPSALSVEEARAALAQAGEQLVELRAQAAAASKADQARRRGDEPRKRADDLTDLYGECEAAAKTLLARHVDQFSAQVRKYLPAGPTWNFEIDVNAAGGGVRVGFRRGAYLHTGWCGTEKAMLVPALACAVADFKPLAEPALMVVADRAFSKARLRQMMKALAQFDGQVIVQTVLDPGVRGLSGWTRIEHKERKIEELYVEEAPIEVALPPTTEPVAEPEPEPEDEDESADTSPPEPRKVPPAPTTTAPAPAEGTLAAPPPPPASTVMAPKIPEQTRMVLREFGYTDADIDVMSVKEASTIIAQSKFKA